MHLSPDPDFEEFALDCIRLSNQESPILRIQLLTLAREWMYAAMPQQGTVKNLNQSDANSGEPWSEMDIA